MTTAAREGSHKLKGRFGEESWKVALEPGCRTICPCAAFRMGALWDNSKHPRLIPVTGLDS